jgi:hypothetical protein
VHQVKKAPSRAARAGISQALRWAQARASFSVEKERARCFSVSHKTVQLQAAGGEIGVLKLYLRRIVHTTRPAQAYVTLHGSGAHSNSKQHTSFKGQSVPGSMQWKAAQSSPTRACVRQLAAQALTLTTQQSNTACELRSSS